MPNSPRLLAPGAGRHLLQPAGRLARDDRSVLAEADKPWQTMLEPPEPCRRCSTPWSPARPKRPTMSGRWARRQVEINRPRPGQDPR